MKNGIYQDKNETNYIVAIYRNCEVSSLDESNDFSLKGENNFVCIPLDKDEQADYLFQRSFTEEEAEIVRRQCDPLIEQNTSFQEELLFQEWEYGPEKVWGVFENIPLTVKHHLCSC